jgi:hypothetical protein
MSDPGTAKAAVELGPRRGFLAEDGEWKKRILTQRSDKGGLAIFFSWDEDVLDLERQNISFWVMITSKLCLNQIYPTSLMCLLV